MWDLYFGKDLKVQITSVMYAIPIKLHLLLLICAFECLI